jgi:hypothetical protein
VSARWTRGEPNEIGSRLEAVEMLAGRRERLVFEITHLDAPYLMAYRIKGPHSLLLPGGRFMIEQRGRGAVFRAEIDVRFPSLVGLLFRRRMKALRAHMREEGDSLRQLVENSSSCIG